MNILLLGSGGREHAFAHSIAKSNKCSQLFIAPGNPGTLQLGINVPIATTDFAAIKSFALENEIKMIIVGPEAPLVEGIYDFVVNDAELRHIPVIGPSKIGAQLEGSKAFSKAFKIAGQCPCSKCTSITAPII